MKKIFYTLLFLICLLPIKVKADTHIDNYFIEMNVQNNGDILVKELFTYKGSFNGAYKTIDLTPLKDDSLFIDSSLYTPTNIKLISVKDIAVDKNITFDYINKDGTKFTENDSATKGSSGYYSITKNNKEYTYKIFNPGSYKGFYIEYVLEDAVINHNDVSEFWLNLFKEVPDYINNLEVRVHIEDNEELLRAWAHGPLEGNINIIDNKNVTFSLNGLGASQSLNIKVVFDKINTLKKSNVAALDNIVEYETKLADIANQRREEARKEMQEKEAREKNIAKLFNFLGITWLIGLVLLIVFIYKNYDKEYISEFKGKYFRDIPNDNNPTYVGYLINKSINTKELSATILSMINKKNIDFVDIDKKDYLLKLVNKDNLDELELKVIDLLFEDNEEVKLSEFKKRAKKDYNDFLKKYNSWNSTALSLATKKNYYEDKGLARGLSILYSILGLLSLFMYNDFVNKYIYFSVMVVGIISFIYFIAYTKRTKEGNEEYLKWIGLKNFMNDFGKMDIKELPEVKLWEKYLVYAVTLGCADKLIKTMKIKIKDIGNIDEVDNISMFNSRLFLITNMNNVVTTSINSAVSSAKSVAASQNSSGSGMGGGFSSGGGFSGGGGGSTGHF